MDTQRRGFGLGVLQGMYKNKTTCVSRRDQTSTAVIGVTLPGWRRHYARTFLQCKTKRSMPDVQSRLQSGNRTRVGTEMARPLDVV